MTLALQLVTYFSAEHLPRLFASLAAQTRRDWTLYVRDQSQNEQEAARIVELLNASDIPYLFEVGENVGFGAGHNRLFEKHQAEAVALVNPDVVFEPTYYERVLQMLEKDEVYGSLQGILLHAGEQGRVIDSLGLKVLGFGDVRDLGTGELLSLWNRRFALNEVLAIFGVSGAAPVYRRMALEKAASTHGPFFDDRFFLYKEDVELAIRLHRAGLKAGMVVSARAEHVRTLSRRSLWTRIRQEFKRSLIIRTANYTNQWRIYFMHMQFASSWSAWIFTLAAEAGRTAGMLILTPHIFFRALREIFCDRASLLTSRRLYQRRFPLRWYP